MRASIFLGTLARDSYPGYIMNFCSTVEKSAGLIRDLRHGNRTMRVKPR